MSFSVKTGCVFLPNNLEVRFFTFIDYTLYNLIQIITRLSCHVYSPCYTKSLVSVHKNKLQKLERGIGWILLIAKILFSTQKVDTTLLFVSVIPLHISQTLKETRFDVDLYLFIPIRAIFIMQSNHDYPQFLALKSTPPKYCG